ncbi:MAG: nicotinate (nicotinamide) nucleotide adenylyltransferase [Nitrospirae bacterium]|nr:nicotinate (nicotinamide) nucleotide adenylyltransferase [Nitrospirota bacterium]
MRLGLLGGTFNPIHYGHLRAAEEVRERRALDRVLFVPAALPPHRDEPEIAPRHRLEMTRLAVDTNPFFEASSTEIAMPGPSYSVRTVRALLEERQGADEFFFITGTDAFREITVWHQWEVLLTLCHFVVVTRPGAPFAALAGLPLLQRVPPETLGALDKGEQHSARCPLDGGRVLFLEAIPPFPLSSTAIRERIRAGLSIKYYLPEPVESYIIAQGLYR